MSFTQSTFAPVSSNSTDTPAFWSYKTNDSSTDVNQPGYFDDKLGQIDNADFLYLFANDGFFIGIFQKTDTLTLPNLLFITDYMPVAPTGTNHVADGDDWVNAVTISTQNTYRWDEDTTASDPGPSTVKINNSDESLATEVYINETTLSGGSIQAIGESIIVGDIIRIQQYGATGNYMTAVVSDFPVDNGTWWSVPITVLENSGGFVAGVDVGLDYWPTRASTRKIDYAEDETENITASTTFQVKLPLTTGDLEAGRYCIHWAYSLSGLANNDEQEARITLDGNVFSDCDSFNRFAGSYNCTSSFKETDLTPGSHQINIEYRAVTGSAKIKGARIKLDKVD